MSMDANFTTPKQTKRLGLRRSSSSIIENRSAKILVGSSAKSKTTDDYNPVSTPSRRVPQSDMKIDYRNSEQKNLNKNTVSIVNTPNTPTNASSTDLQRRAVSTNCRPYRLALSKQVRERMTKKRLEFYLANEMEIEGTEEQQNKEQNDNATKVESQSSKELLQQIEIDGKELTTRQKHLKKVAELQKAIAIWKEGFSSALHDLQQKLDPRLETAQLLQSLHIPQEMIKYIND